ncbi:hypothetical protein G9F72_018405 [Clostridium estertheticum]|uniref:hypothetical protein n=1 Tax=Clostridium estertheticum TaxID=238834 RepID=UPI001CD0D040|nr:hypothetical protein [Clostridium estertheticum]MBZ9688306.1 hypothetical protein [Clostridium estertheticum]
MNKIRDSDSRKEYSDGIDDLDGISEEKLKNIFKDYKIEVSWVGIWNKHLVEVSIFQSLRSRMS